MAKAIEFRVRAVTRYIVTRHESAETSGSTQTVGEFDNLDHANRAGQALADVERAIHSPPEDCVAPERASVTFHGVEQKPGAVMRCKVVLTERRPSVQLMWGQVAKGRTEPRTNDQGRDYTWVDPEDPANYKMDGEGITFAAVWGSGSADGKNACLENRIFGEATPSFNLSAHIRNPSVLALLQKGQEYYVDFVPAPPASV